ncbi:NAD(P)-dependent oxidoreductase [Alphaproteobacteria bacterium]|nr:NAD(P)-dependent oxidoreductase [Alphaproteobacteria bacterium]
MLGHTGFIGQAISNSFIRKGIELECVGRDKINLEDKSSILKLQNLITPDCNVIMTVGVKKQFGDSVENWLRNEIIIANFVEALSKSSPAHLLYLSSAAVYGEDKLFEKKITEDTNFDARSYYSISKINAENILGKIARERNFPICFARPPLIYGAGDNSLGYGPTAFCYKVVHEEEIQIWGDGSELREFIWIDDLADILVRLSQNSYDGKINIVSGTSYSFADVLTALRKTSKKPVKFKFMTRTKEKTDNLFSATRLQDAVGDYKFTPLIDGIKMLYQQLEKKFYPYEY